jgi:hypothetical protein
VPSFDRLPILEKDISRECAAVGASVSISITGAIIISTSHSVDPIWTACSFSAFSEFLVGALILVIMLASIFFAFKQYEYYYGESDEQGKKSGVFKRSIKEINRAERFLDIVLATVGGLLISFALIPTFWFLVLSIYSCACILRFYITLRRDHYLCDFKLPDFYFKTMEREHNGMKVKEILAGWIISFIILGLLGLISFVFLVATSIPWYFTIISAYIMVALYCGFSFLFGNLSLSFGSKLSKTKQAKEKRIKDERTENRDHFVATTLFKFVIGIMKRSEKTSAILSFAISK